MKRLPAYLLLILLSLAWHRNWAQEFSFYFPEANRQLPQQFVYALETDKEGYLWVGTGEGIVKFNGSEHIPVNRDGKPCLDFCTALQHTKNDLYAGFNDGSIARLQQGELKNIQGRADSRIAGFQSAGSDLVVASQKTVYRIVDDQLLPMARIPEGDVIYAFALKDKQLYLATSSGVWVHYLDRQQQKELSPHLFSNLLIYKDKVFATGDSGLYSIESIGAVKVLDLSAYPSPVNSPMAVLGRQLYLCRGNHLLELQAAPAVHLSAVFSLPDAELMMNCLEVANRHIWLGTYGKGLAHFDPHSFFVHLGKEGEQDPSLKLITTGEGFTEISRKQVRLFRPRRTVGGSGPIRAFTAPQSLTGAAAFLAGDLLTATEAGNVLRFDIQTGRSTPVSEINSRLPRNKSILSIDVHGNEIWICVEQHGAFRFAADGRFLEQYNTATGLLHNDVFKTWRDSKGNTWFITRASGLCRLGSDGWKYFTLQDGLASLEFTDITEDSGGNVWLSTAGGGLTRIRGNAIDNFNTESGLSADYFHGIQASGSVIYAYSREALNIISGNRLRVLRSDEIGFIPDFVPRSLVIGRNWLVMGSNRGPVMYFFESIAQTDQLGLLIRSCTVDDKKKISSPAELPYGNYKLAFRVEKISLNPGYQAGIEYKLEGFDKEWQTLTSNEVVYQSVRDGVYRFVVREKGRPGNFVTFDLDIDVPFWKKPLNYVLGVLFIVLIVIFTFRIRIKRLQEKNRALEEKVQERTAQLRRKNKELEDFSYAISHDLKNPAINIVELVRIIREEGFEDPELTKETFEQLDISSEKLLRTLQDLISILKYSNAQELPKEKVNICELVDEVRKSIGHSITESQAVISCNTEAFESLYYNRQQLYSVLYNLISNAIKYRKTDVTPVVEVRSFIQKDVRYVSVKDNGIGMDLEKNRDKLFGMFQRLHDHVEGSGIGLHLVKSIITKNGGDIEVVSSPGVGTEFILRFGPSKR